MNLFFSLSLSHMGTYKLQTEHCFTTRKLLAAFDVLFKLFVLPSYVFSCVQEVIMYVEDTKGNKSVLNQKLETSPINNYLLIFYQTVI